ncbi:hypothetical protein [Cellulomonas humilata]|uniref:Uncharacterized membrane protein YkvA (DUF1232 family) n=1 Tax=Cellulomonas humilata TaxID=144055 RepID=A0ABU0EEK6_9CELL|nr:hypothetical protein [Cellulomonas humilata]MDQ0373693.1 uncharacterized membrane protein YkvA (DUF1232 family) [Cellulomonas humilata]
MSDATTTTPAPRDGLRTWLHDLGAVVAQGARLWARSWPVLLVIALLAVAGRHAAGWAAVNASTVNNTLGWAVLVLAPLSMVAGIVAMLHVLRRDLPALAAIGRTRGPDDAASGHERGLIDVLASVFVPFLALYASYGLLEEDRSRFLNTAAYREFMENGFSLTGDGPDGAFVDLATGWVLVAVVVVAVVLRWLLGRWEGRSHRRALAFAGAYVEAFWLLAVAAFATQLLDEAWAWAESRRAVAIVLDWWLTLLDTLGPLAGPVDAVVDTVAGVLGNLDDLVVIPLAWLTVGAVVYGHKLAAPPKREPRLRPAAWQRLPAPVRRWTTEAVAPVVGDVRGRFTALTDGLRRLAVAGLGPMLVFALAFLVATRLEEAIQLLVRAVSGPRDVDTWLAFAPMISSVATAVGLTVTMALLAAGVDRILAGQAAVAAQEPVAAEA